MDGTQSPKDISTRLQKIATTASWRPKLALTTLAHHMDEAWMLEAYRRTRKDGAVGVDRETAEEFAANLEGNLRALLDEAKAGTYRAPPVRRVYIPKDGGKTRPIGIPTFRDKVLQRAVAMVLEAVYEQDFLDCSYGFRPGRSPHQALEALRQQAMAMGGCWVVELDIQSFFDTMGHVHLREILQGRVRDGVLCRLIGKWLNAGVLEGGVVHHPEQGSPQGGVISPLLANILLHEVLDEWFETVVKPRLKGRAFMVRFADDAVLGFSTEEDARKVLAVLPKRFGRYGLTLHPEKTRLVDFRRPAIGRPTPGTFDFLGFTHYWAATRKGGLTIKRRTMKKRLGRAIRRIWEWCREYRHEPLSKQHEELASKVEGHYQYYGITGNFPSLVHYWRAVERAWRFWLSRRSQRAHMTWERFKRLPQLVLPRPRITHSIYRVANP
jgi:group II intron reverse transcriptase/maturase